MTTNKHRMILAGALTAVLMVAQVCAQGFGVRSVGSVQQHNGPMQVTVVFTDPADPVTAAEASRYSIPGVTVTAAAMMADLPDTGEAGNGEGGITSRVLDNQCVILTVTGLGSTATTLTVTGVKNASGPETFTGSKGFVPSGYSWCDTGIAPDGVRKVGKVIAISDEGFDIFNNGRTAWAGQDEFTFVFKQVTGAFDFSNRVEFVDYGSRWSRAGVMIREDLDLGAAASTFGRYCTAHANPVRAWNDAAAGTLAGNNQYESNYRRVIDSATTAGDGSGAANPPAYPSAWVRLQRTSDAPDTINAFYSNDGAATWTQLGGGRDLNLDTDGETVVPLANALYVGAAFCAEVNNISDQNPPAARQRYYLTQVRFKELAVPTVRNFDPNPTGFSLNIVDSPGGSAANPATVKLTVNGALADTATFTAVKSGDTTRVVYRQATAFPVGSANTVIVEFRDDANQALTSQQQWTAAYVAIPASYAITTASTPGMVANTYQIDYARAASDPPENRLATAEQQQARGIIDEAGVPYPNVAAATGVNAPISIVNWEQEMIDIDATPEDGPDNFNSARPALPRMAAPNEYIPGIPGTGYDNSHTGNEVGRLDNNIVTEVLTYLNLSAGAYRMGVNSDDGFKVSCAPGAPDVTGLILGSFNGGRGAGDTLFDFYVEQTGYYPVRLLWWEGSGGANVEWFTEDLATSQRYLVNGSESQAVKGYRTGQNRAYVKSIVPANGYENTDVRPTIRVEIVNGTTSVVAGQTRLVLDGVEVVSGGGNSISWTPSADYSYGSTHTGQLFWTENTTPATTWTVDYRFTIKAVSAATLPPDTFWIEMEDFDYGNGQSLPSASVMPYAGGEYDGTLLPTRAVYNVDYWRRDRGPLNGAALGGYVYRTDIPGWVDEGTQQTDFFVPMGANTGGANSERPGNPVFTVTANYKSGWSGGGWYNYTRTLPQGIYGAFLVASHWENAAPADGQINSRLAKVVSGVGTTTQTLQELGIFNAPGNGTANSFTPLKTSSGDIAAFKASGKTTLRLTIDGGDTDYIALAPISGVAPKITGSYPVANAQVARDDAIRVTIEDFSTSVVLNSVKLFFDSVDVTAQATITKPADITTITFDPAGLMAVGAHTYRVDFNDSASKAFTTTVNFTVVPLGVPGQFLIEAEDFNNAGQPVAAASTMPYLGNAYNGLPAVFDVDYRSAETLTSADGWTPVYRTGPPVTATTTAPLNDNLGGTLGRMRGATWQMNVNYKIGWTGGGDWMNYTRNISAGHYEVWAALSHGDAPTSASRITASLDLVTGDVSQPDAQQTKTPLGIFNAPPTGGWGANALIPMTDTAGGPVKVVSLPAPPTTLRFYPSSGDFDYFVLFPSSAPTDPPTVGAASNPSGQVEITFTDKLYAADAVEGPYVEVVGATSPYPVTGGSAMKYYRAGR